MKRTFVTNLILLLFLNFLVKTFWMFGIDRSVQNLTGAEEYGLYFSLLSLSILLNILLDAGINNFNNRSIAQNPEELKSQVEKIIPLKLSLAFIYGIVVLLSGWILGYSARQFSVLWVLIINQFLLSLVLYLRTNISGLHLFRTDSFLSVLDRFVVILICGYLLWIRSSGESFRIEWLVYSQTAGYLFSAFVVFLILLRKTGKLKLNFSFKSYGQILRKSYPFAILILLMSFFNRFDSVLLERMLPDGKTQAGIYAQSFRILDAVNMFAVLFAGMLLPIFSRMLKNGENVGEMVKLSFSLIILPGLTLGILSWFYNREIIAMLYVEHIEFSARVYQILILGFIFISTSYIYGTLLTANGSLRHLNLLALVTVLLNLGLNLILIPRFKALGSAWASLISQSFFALAQAGLSMKILKLKLNLPILLRLIGFVVLLTTAGWQVSKSVDAWLTGFALLCLLAVVLIGVLKIITPSEIRKIIQNKQEADSDPSAEN